MKQMKMWLVALTMALVGMAAEAATYTGIINDPDDWNEVGKVTVSVTSSKKGKSKISGSVKFGSKTYSIVSQKVYFSQETGYSIKIKKLATMTVAFSEEGVYGSLGQYEIEASGSSGAASSDDDGDYEYEEDDYEEDWGDEDVGSLMDGEFTLQLEDYPDYEGDGEMLDYMPDDATIYATNGRWKTDKAGSVKLKKYKGGDYDIIEKGEGNFCGLKLSYNKKKGTWKGSFKVYILTFKKNGDVKSLKSMTMKVSGSGTSGTASNKKLGTCELSLF